MPDDAEYHFRLAVLAGDEQPGRAMDELRRSVALGPWNAQHQIELGLRYEAEGNGAAAERCFLRAAEADNQYLPRWTLANYYFRQGDRAKFWASARAAAQMAYGDAAPLFRLCDAAGETGDLIERLGVRKPEIRASYLSYLLAQGRIDAAGAAARRVLESGREADVPLVLAACDRMLAERRADEAMDVWNRLAAARRIPFGRLSAGMVTNGQFLAAPISRGFDWRLPNMDGV
ncbi:MAG TPA: hypothetical protein VFQ39_01665, partial [Longimicrobium sp.]|nr:hypothetical protein [Longimicrobium sp.]